MIKKFIQNGEHWIWLNAAAVAISLAMVLGILGLITAKGLVYFWPKDTYQLTVTSSSSAQEGQTKIQYLGEEVDSAPSRDANGVLVEEKEQHLFKIGNRESYGMDFIWIDEAFITQRILPTNAVTIERREWGNFYGFIDSVHESTQVLATASEKSLLNLLDEKLQLTLEIMDTIDELEKDDFGRINYQIEKLRLEQKRLELDKEDSPEALFKIETQRNVLNQEFTEVQQRLQKLREESEIYSLNVRLVDGKAEQIPLSQIVRWYQPNNLNTLQKSALMFSKLWEFLSDDPREANTEGGIFPAIFGTVMMVLIMAVIVSPFGVIAAVYLHEYAHQSWLTKIVRIAVHNLAGVPSIVYGVFGLGFFVYFLGGNIDELFFPESSPAPVFGTPGLLWASLTLALLTLPVVIVSAEEGLSRVPKSIREGSLALGATKAETLWKTVLPMASPSMMTGLILAIARAAGEVAPLMLVGVVKLAPTLPLDLNSPFLHLDRKFMHLGFHIYDVGFQSPNVEAARPLVYATSLLLIVVILLLNLTAIRVRNRLRERYKALEH